MEIAEKYNFKEINLKKILDSTCKASNNFQFLSLLKAKEAILKHGKYSKEELENILDSLIDAETARKYILKELYQREPLTLKDIMKTFNFEENQIIRDIYYLKAQGYIEEIIESQGVFKYKVKHLKDSFKVNYFEPVSKINDLGNCCHCGLCLSICPLDCIDLSTNYLYIDEETCIKCGLCYSVCPQSFSFDEMYNSFKKMDSSIKKSESFGYYNNLYSAMTRIDAFKEKSQHGGIATTLLYYLLNNNLVDAVITIKHSKSFWKPKIEIIEDKSELYNTTGRIYSHSPILSILDKVKKYDRVAIVALPCMIRALVKASFFPIKLPFFNNIKYKIGLFCIESFSYENIAQLLNEKFNIDIEEITKMNIVKGRFFVTLDSGEITSVSLSECDPYGFNYCHYCGDITSEMADISIGSIGSKVGWSTVITRNKIGQQIFDGAVEQNLIEKTPLIDINVFQSNLEKIANQKKSKCITVELQRF